jgi:predicted dehydrogenase
MLFFDNAAFAIRKKVPPAVSPRENLTIIKILEAAYQSHEENKVIFI